MEPFEKIMQDRRERHEAESLAGCRTEAQRERCAELYADEPDLDMQVYAERAKGASIVQAIRAYLKTGDPAKITEAVYAFATSGAGYNEIAHFDIHGFRHVFADPAHFVELIEADTDRRHNPLSVHVYTDGVIDAEVREQVAKVAAHAAEAERDERIAKAERRQMGWALARVHA